VLEKLEMGGTVADIAFPDTNRRKQRMRDLAYVVMLVLAILLGYFSTAENSSSGRVAILTIVGLGLVGFIVLAAINSRMWKALRTWKCPTCEEQFGTQKEVHWTQRRHPFWPMGPVLFCKNCKKHYPLDWNGKLQDLEPRQKD
jgi:hypothetical protein